MNILYISNKKGWGGIVNWMEKTAVGLQKRGHKVWIISNKKSKLTQEADNNIEIIPKNLGMDFNPFKIIWLVRFILKHKVDLVVTNITKEVLIGGIAAKITKVPNIRRIGTERDFDDPKIKEFYRLIDLTIAPCKFVVESILRNKDFIKPCEVSYVYNGCEPRYFTASEIYNFKKKFQIPTDKVILGSTCQFSKTKNICGLIDVFAKLTEKFDNLHLILAGEGPELENINEKIKNLSLTGKVIIAGFVKDKLEIASTYDIGILFSNLEGFSNSVVEYMAVGTPVVCSDVGGQNEIVKNDYNGFLVEHGNKEQLYERLQYLIKHSKIRENFSRNAYHTVEKNFSEIEMIDNLEKIFKDYALKRNN
ncbi:MAG: glycosyltransferase [Candidatus Cloacimonadia bacterium]